MQSTILFYFPCVVNCLSAVLVVCVTEGSKALLSACVCCIHLLVTTVTCLLITKYFLRFDTMPGCCHCQNILM